MVRNRPAPPSRHWFGQKIFGYLSFPLPIGRIWRHYAAK